MYEGTVVSFDPPTAQVRVCISQLMGNHPVTALPRLYRTENASMVSAPRVGDIVLVYFPGGSDTIPYWIPQFMPTETTVIEAKWFGARDGKDSTKAFARAIDACPPGGTVLFEAGRFLIDPQVADHQITVAGRGRWSTWLAASTAFTGPLLFFDLPASSPSIRAYYGAGIRDIGLDLEDAPGATGLLIGDNAGWPHIQNALVNRGAVSLDVRAPNGWVEDVILLDAGKFISIGDMGLEIMLRDVNMSRNITGTTTVAIECIATTTGIHGAIYIENVRLSCNTGVGEVINGLWVEAPSILSIPVFADKLIIDNTIGGGPGMNFKNITDVSAVNSWVNCGSADGGPCVRIEGGGNFKFTNNSYFGGASGIGSPKTYDFVGGSTFAFQSTQNYCPTGPVYFLPASGGPTDMRTDDIVPGATVMAQITNDVPQFVTAMSKTWGPKQFVAPVTLFPDPIVAVSAFLNSWTNVSGVVTYYRRDPSLVVWVSGTVTGGASALAFDLPTGYRPLQTQNFLATVLGTTDTVQVQVETTGAISIFAAAFPVGGGISLELSFLWGGG